MEKNDYNIPVGEFAKLCGTTRDTLRHYKETGILVPYVNEENGYNYYAMSQVSSFFFINAFRRTGIPVNEIASMIHHAESDFIPAENESPVGELVHDVLANQIHNLKNEMNMLSKQIASLTILLWIFDYRNEKDALVPGIHTIPKVSVIKTPISNPETAYSMTNVAEDITKHIDYITSHTHIPPYPIGASISLEDIKNQKYIYRNIITLADPKSVRKKITQLPSTKVVGCFHEDSSKPISDTYKALLDYIEEHNLTPLSDLFSISIFNIYRGENTHTYLKCLFICIE